MPTYAYDAVDQRGKRLRGQADSPNPAALSRSLANRGLIVVGVTNHEEAAPRGQSAPSLGNARTAVLEVTRALAALLPAGMPLARALSASSALASGALAAALSEVRARVERGDSFANALTAHPAFFSPLYVGMIRAGERSGDIAGSLSLASVSSWNERRHSARSSCQRRSIR